MVNLIFAQSPIKEFVKENTSTINSIHADSVDFSDLEPIGRAIGNTRIVMLGEATHGDASTFLAKTRLIKYLHEVKGFDVLAFETDFYAMNIKSDLLAADVLQYDSFFFTYNMHSVWPNCDACATLLYNYLPQTLKTSNPIIVSGFDNQIFGKYSQHNFKNDMDSFLRTNQVSYISKDIYYSQLLPFFEQVIQFQPVDTTQYQMMWPILDSIETELRDKNLQNDFWYMCFQSFISFSKSRYYGEAVKKWRLAFEARDSQMANNLRWLVQTKYSNEKIIVWAANAHLTKKPPYYKNMGVFYEESMGTTSDSSYIIGFTSNIGQYSVIGNRYDSTFTTIAKSKRYMNYRFEQWMPKKLNYGFVDFKEYNTLYPNSTQGFYMKASGHRDLFMDWTKAYEGIFYIRQMYPCVKFER